MRHLAVWGGIAIGLAFALCFASACQPDITPVPAASEPLAAGDSYALLPTLEYNGHFPVGYPTPVPVIYNMNDYANRDWATLNPEYGPMGGWANWSWLAIHKGPNQFNWAPIEDYLAISENYRVTLRDGTVINKPIAISIQVFPDAGYDNTPEWVYKEIPGSPTYNGRLVGQIVDPDGDGPCPGVAAPNWGNAIWRDRFDEMVRALGAKYNDDPRIDSVWIATGLYGETVVEKNLYPGCDVYRFGAPEMGQWVQTRVLPVYREAFPTKPLYLINTGGGCIRKDTTEIAYQMPVRIGAKHNSLTYDVRDEYNRETCGKMETINPYSATMPIAFEHAFGANPWQVYWSTLNGLSHHADLFDFPYSATDWDILDVLAELKDLLHSYDQWEFIDRYLGKTLDNAPGVWIVFRDTQWERYFGWTYGGQCTKAERWGWGEEDRDWPYWLERVDAPGGHAVPLCQIPPNRDPSECETEYPNIYTRYYELPEHLRSNPSAEAKWWDDAGGIKPEIIDKIYGYYSSRRTDEPTDPYIFLDVSNGWSYWRNLPLSEPGGTAAYTATVIYLDKGWDTWTFSYSTYSGEEVTKYVRKTNSLQWKAQVWRLEDMYLADAMTNQCDVVISSNGDGNDYFHMVLIDAEGQAQPAATPTPTLPPNIPAARADDLQERTESLRERLQRIRDILGELVSP